MSGRAWGAMGVLVTVMGGWASTHRWVAREGVGYWSITGEGCPWCWFCRSLDGAGEWSA